MNCFNTLWVEKYRPKTLDDLCISEESKSRLLAWGQELPHLLLVGHQGVGKTSLARIIVTDILKCDYLYINASDENGIDTIRTKVTGFVQTKSFDGKLKVVILDEADGLTIDGQKCLRNLMESYASGTRFILTGNAKHKINVTIQSRCISLDIKPSLRDAVKRCLHILSCEGVSVDREQGKQVVELVRRYFPDLRLCIGELSRCCMGGVLRISQTQSNSQLCVDILKNVIAQRSLETRKYLIENDSQFNSEWDRLMVDLLNHIYESDIEDSKKKAMVITIADHLDRATRVSDKEINFFACLLNLENV